MKLKKHVANAGVICCTIALCAAVAACSPATDGANPNTAEDTAVSEIVNASPTDPYASDEVCLSCHGGTYEAVAQLTDAYGDSNPHAGAHGNGTMSCGTCHTDGSSKPLDENNYCLNCHNWPREEQAYIKYMDL